MNHSSADNNKTIFKWTWYMLILLYLRLLQSGSNSNELRIQMHQMEKFCTQSIIEIASIIINWCLSMRHKRILVEPSVRFAYAHGIALCTVGAELLFLRPDQNCQTRQMAHSMCTSPGDVSFHTHLLLKSGDNHPSSYPPHKLRGYMVAVVSSRNGCVSGTFMQMSMRFLKSAKFGLWL